MSYQEKLPALVRELQLADDLPVEYDVAEWNLLLAHGLPGAADLDAPRLLDIIDEWARQVRLETQRSYYRFLDSPSEYQNSQGYFCVLVLVTVLERDLGIRYNPERVRDQSFQDPFCVDPDFRNSRDLFIHGILDGPGGTCASMPVLYTAVGRRLGYPMKLVEAPGHLFSRWDDPKGSFNGVPDRFNIDAAGHGFACLPDEHYRVWPRPWSDEGTENGWYLQSLTPRGEIAAFLATRGSCLEDNGRIRDAFQCFDWAFQLTTDQRYYSEAAKLQHRLQVEAKRHIESIDRIHEMRRLAADRQSTQQQKPTQQQKRNLVSTPVHLQTFDGHGPSCQCVNCIRQRNELLVKCDGDFGHGPSCQCLNCQENRQMAQAASRQGQFPSFP